MSDWWGLPGHRGGLLVEEPEEGIWSLMADEEQVRGLEFGG